MLSSIRPLVGIVLLGILGFLSSGCQHVGVSAKQPAVATPASEEGEELSPYAVTVVLPNDPNYLRNELGKYGLVPLNAAPLGQSVERVKFLWQRYRRPTIVFELEFNADGSGVHRSRIWDVKSGWKTDKTVPLPKKSLDFYRYGFEQWKLYELPWYDGSGALDGSSWLIELQRGQTYHALYRVSPSEGPVWYFGKMLIEDTVGGPYMPIN